MDRGNPCGMKLLPILLILGAGCEGLTSPPEPIVSVLKRNEVGCFQLITDVKLAASLDVPGTCDYGGASSQLIAGVDLIEVVIDYGPDVEFAGNTHAPPPTVTVAVDGAASETAVQLSDEHRVGSRAYFVATFRAPKTPSTDVQLTVGVNAGFKATVPITFKIVPPPVSLTLVDCPLGIQCQLFGGVGNAHIRISVPGDVPQTVLVHATLDGFVQPDPVPPVTTEVAEGHTEHTTATPVPAVHDGAVWVIAAQIGAEHPSLVTATIRAPMISSQLSCGDTCTLAPNATVGLEITAPVGIRPLQAMVDTRIDGIPVLVAAPVTLIANADGTATGLLALRAPSQTGQWQIAVSVAGYFAPAIVATIQ